MPAIRWVNHASYLLSHGPVCLLTDPWLFGSAFDDGWDLLCETRFRIEEFAGVTHLWFSHEHPDHFAPAVLRRIPRELIPSITVLFQETRDGKVLRFCRDLGFRTQELPDRTWYDVAPDLRVMCGKVPFYDSWLLAEVGGVRILNMNDCVVDGDAVASEIARVTGPVDVLLTQYSYANWLGNAEDVELRRAAAREKLDRVRLQVDAFRPRFTIPFASLVYFSHEENGHLNDAVNTMADAHRCLSALPTTPVVLYPDDVWEVGAEHDNGPALAAYAAEYRRTDRPRRRTTPVPLEQLTELAGRYRDRMRRQNSRVLMALLGLPPLRYFPAVTFALTDLGVVVTFDFRRGLRVRTDGADGDVALSSESLANVFRHDWGFDTLLVNGRFRASPAGCARMTKLLFLGPLNNTGRSLHPRTLVDRAFVRRAVRRLLRRRPV